MRGIVCSLVVVGVACSSPKPSGLHGDLGYLSPGRLATWVPMCAVPLARLEHPLGVEVSCEERGGETPTWSVSVLYKDAAISVISMSERSQAALMRSANDRLPALVGEAIARPLVMSVDKTGTSVDGTSTLVLREQVAGGQVIPPVASIEWTATLRPH